MELSAKVILFFLYAAGLKECSSYRILGIFPLNGRSHMMMFERLMKGLAARGHQVDVASRFPLRQPYVNYTDIHLKMSPGNFASDLGLAITYDRIVDDNIFNIHFMTTELGNFLCEEGLKDPYLQGIIKNPPTEQPYDLVIVEVSIECKKLLLLTKTLLPLM